VIRIRRRSGVALDGDQRVGAARQHIGPAERANATRRVGACDEAGEPPPAGTLQTAPRRVNTIRSRSPQLCWPSVESARAARRHLRRHFHQLPVGDVQRHRRWREFGDCADSVPCSGPNTTPVIGRARSREGCPLTAPTTASCDPSGEIATDRVPAGSDTLSGIATGNFANGRSGTANHARAATAPAAAAEPSSTIHTEPTATFRATGRSSAA
jgi:hypothetical protein